MYLLLIIAAAAAAYPLSPGARQFGDMALSEQQSRAIRMGLRDTVQRWPGASVPYRVREQDFDDSENALLLVAITLFNADSSCVRFRPADDGDMDYVLITGDNTGCWSYSGRVGGGAQQLNLQNDTENACLDYFTTQHVLSLAAGSYSVQKDPLLRSSLLGSLPSTYDQDDSGDLFTNILGSGDAALEDWLPDSIYQDPAETNQIPDDSQQSYNFLLNDDGSLSSYANDNFDTSDNFLGDENDSPLLPDSDDGPIIYDDFGFPEDEQPLSNLEDQDSFLLSNYDTDTKSDSDNLGSDDTYGNVFDDINNENDVENSPLLTNEDSYDDFGLLGDDNTDDGNTIDTDQNLYSLNDYGDTDDNQNLLPLIDYDLNVNSDSDNDNNGNNDNEDGSDTWNSNLYSWDGSYNKYKDVARKRRSLSTNDVNGYGENDVVSLEDLQDGTELGNQVLFLVKRNDEDSLKLKQLYGCM